MYCPCQMEMCGTLSELGLHIDGTGRAAVLPATRTMDSLRYVVSWISARNGLLQSKGKGAFLISVVFFLKLCLNSSKGHRRGCIINPFHNTQDTILVVSEMSPTHRTIYAHLFPATTFGHHLPLTSKILHRSAADFTRDLIRRGFKDHNSDVDAPSLPFKIVVCQRD